MRFLPNKPHYTGAKHGLIGMYCAAALAYASRNIRINVICPGLIKTEKAMRVLGGNEKALDGRIPAGHIGESTDVAAAVLWLFSDEARYITGAVLPIDGGQSVA
jgi:NAD(P)-dependent dehydrogenase (short-subunit alcohol dehydrogenase family)